jgi:hypothetical protein
MSQYYKLGSDCVLQDSSADGILAIAPSQLKAALRPGCLKTVHPELEDGIVEQFKDTLLVGN